jgi:hypothetical protein
MKNPIENSHGKVWYGMHFYPGVAQYSDPKNGDYCVYLNEDTLREMDPTFAGRPIFVEHVETEQIPSKVDELRKDADGWVIESFFNAADGKHWVKFITVTDRAEHAIRSGLRLSNAYLPLTEAKGGRWNGVEYLKEITSGEYEHLAIVNNPRYEESIILTPEEFKNYNNEKKIELTRIANSKSEKGDKGMGALNFFKRSKVENSIDLESTMVELPKSKKEIKISDLVTEMDKIINMHGYANDDHLVKMDNGDEMSVADMKKKMNKDAADKIEAEKAKNAASEEGGEPGEDEMKNDESEEGSISSGVKDVGDRGGDESMANEEDEDSKKKQKEEKKENAVKKAKALKNAGPLRESEASVAVYTSADGVARGKAKYGSN